MWRGSFSIPQSTADRMKAIAAERGCSIADVAREAVRIGMRYIEQRERRAS
jgi:hypothetical protein